MASENEYTARARPLLLILTSGMARGYGELADRFESGARANKADPGSFRKNMNFYRAQASRFSLHFAQAFGEFQKSKDETVALAFSYPTGSANPPLVLTKVANGISASGNDVETAQKQNIERAILLTTCASAGAPDDPAKTQEVLKQPDTKVPRAVFVTAMANALYDQSQLFSRQKLDDPEKMKILCARAQEALKGIPESKASKDLNGKIEKTLKTSKASSLWRRRSFSRRLRWMCQ